MSVQLDFDIGILKKQIEDDFENAVIKTLHGVVKDIEPFVPYNTGELSKSVEIDKNNLSIVWTAPHAEYVYNMPKSNNFSSGVNTKATSNWVGEALSAYNKKWVDDIKRNFHKLQ